MVDWLVLSRLMATPASGLIKWWLLPLLWSMATSTIYDWLMGFTPKKWRLLPVVWLWIFTSSMVWLMGFPPSVVWLLGFTPLVVWLISFYPISGLISGFTPTVIWFSSNVIIPQWRLPSVCIAMSVHFPSYSSSFISFTCYKELCIHTFMHIHHIYNIIPTWLH